MNTTQTDLMTIDYLSEVEGREDTAREIYGDQAVDEAIAANIGITAEQSRTPGFLNGVNGGQGA